MARSIQVAHAFEWGKLLKYDLRGKTSGNGQMDNIYVYEKILSLGGCLPMPLGYIHVYRVAMVREKVWKMKFFPGQGKVREFEFESRKIANFKGKVREFQNFFKRDGLWQCINVLKEFEKSELFPP